MKMRNILPLPQTQYCSLKWMLCKPKISPQKEIINQWDIAIQLLGTLVPSVQDQKTVCVKRYGACHSYLQQLACQPAGGIDRCSPSECHEEAQKSPPGEGSQVHLAQQPALAMLLGNHTSKLATNPRCCCCCASIGIRDGIPSHTTPRANSRWWSSSQQWWRTTWTTTLMFQRHSAGSRDWNKKLGTS